MTDLTTNLPGPIFTRGADGLPTQVEKLADPILPATPDYLVCLDGCKHYCDWIVDSQDMGEGRELQRYCRAFATAAELMDVSDSTVYACSRFVAPWWSIKGWLRWWKCRKQLKEAREIIAQRSLQARAEEENAEEAIIILDD